MKKILSNVIRKKIIKSIKYHGKGVSELVIDINLSFGVCNSIELDPEGNVLLHMFDENDFDIVCDVDDLTEEDKWLILKTLNTI